MESTLELLKTRNSGRDSETLPDEVKAQIVSEVFGLGQCSMR